MYSVSCEKELGNRCVTTYLGKKVLLTNAEITLKNTVGR